MKPCACWPYYDLIDGVLYSETGKPFLVHNGRKLPIFDTAGHAEDWLRDNDLRGNVTRPQDQQKGNGTMTEQRYYGVSSGNGNDGISHMFPDYVCKTNEPWRLAELAAITTFKPEFQEWARENVEIDGEADYTISACFYHMPDDDEDCERDYCPLIVEVFPWERDDDFDARHGARPMYESLDECFGDDTSLVKTEA